MKKFYLCTVFSLFFLSADVHEDFDRLSQLFSQKEWTKVISESKAFISDHSEGIYANKAHYFLANAYVATHDYDLANYEISIFLENSDSLQNFEDALKIKFQCAEKFKSGAKVHPFGIKSIPKILSGRELAYEIFEEIVESAPKSDLGCRALFAKGELYFEDKKYHDAIEDYLSLIRRFPRSALASKSFVKILESYLELSRFHNPDQDFLELAKTQYEAFTRDYPQSPDLEETQRLFVKIQDVYAEDLFKAAVYFEKRRKFESARLYYDKLIRTFPDSYFAKEAIKKLQSNPKYSQ